ncbi:zinc finger and BTB domain-containing protein 12-like [Gadus chalcogrammus]|uniref:zinc finger and BTB domain-containing protein 12-like n=1 Tax=Gadus chalcogrammus TaxID=1042646 RepID=UPI0024C4866D|nr:zinc finger and BTB domain-containing protein 12-like [Gadus chalcogrammus]
MEALCFRLPGHGDATLKHMNALRSRQHFCDVTIVASDNQTFRGHKVVLAACSPFLRDQFLLSPASKLQVSLLHSSSVVCNLLLSCYTGVLQFGPEEIVNYLTAASYLQMEHIVERCRGALKKYMLHRSPAPQPKIKTEGLSTPVIASGTSMSPPAGHASPSQPASPHGGSQDEHGEGPGGAGGHHGNSPLLDESCIKVNASDEEEAARREYELFNVYPPDEEEEEEQQQGGAEGPQDDRGGPSDASHGDPYSGMDGELVGVNPSEQEELEMGGFLRDNLSMAAARVFRRRYSEPRAGRARGRGFKKRKWAGAQERRPLGLAGPHPDMWYPGGGGGAGGMMGGGGPYGVDYSRADAMSAAAAGYLGVDLPPMDFGGGGGEAHADDVAAMAAASDMHHRFLLGEAVVGSTSSVGAGPVICDHCGVTFPSPHALAAHVRASHLLYACPCCGKHFQSAPSLTRHMAVHRGGAGKSHQCPLCYKTFTQKSTLIDHMNLHSGERPHRCAYCHARFAHKPALRRHLKEQHGKTTGQNSLHEQEERAREEGVLDLGLALPEVKGLLSQAAS